MEDSKKKPVMIGAIVVCLAVAGLITVMSRSREGGIESIKRGTMIWVKCNNPKCNAEYEMDNKDYMEFMQKNANPMSMEPPAMKCEKCGENSAFKAVKCEKCGTIFFWGNPTDFADRCPKCGYSYMEDARKKAAGESTGTQESQ